ncbi:DUF2868 domain-containing protein [uncultured Nitrospira sp.]|uniref:DUF2868 domain-containing protein n=1 Tax=uncultured Nitrospira sp. TaxID=157176 RepID=UPI0031406121
MNSRAVSKILLIQALEQSDPQARYISHSTRQRATQQAKKRSSPESLSSTEGSIQFFTNRAESLWNFLSTSYPMITESFRGAQVTIPYTIVAIPAFAAGLLINGLGSSQRVNLLNFPLLILLLWNIGTYAGTILLPLLGKDLSGPLLHHLSKGFTTATEWLGKGPWPKIALPGRADRKWIIQATERFMNLWWRHCHPLIISRVRHLLHIGAACLALGIILSMYVRGLVLDYQATWESTFLSAAQVQTVLHGLLGPAAWLLGFPFPPVEDLALLQAPGQGSAAAWIHMWALTAFVGIVIPRITLAWLSARSAHKAAESFTLPLNEPYYLQLLSTERGQGTQIDIVPYSYQPSPAALDCLGQCLLDLIGNQATLHWRDPLLYGQASVPWLQATSSPQTVVLVCNLAQTPEAEVHGELFHMLQTSIEPCNGQHHLLLVLDQEPYRHLADQAQMRGRQQTWQRLANDYHLQIVAFDAKDTSRDQLLEKAQAALWPTKGEMP